MPTTVRELTIPPTDTSRGQRRAYLRESAAVGVRFALRVSRAGTRSAFALRREAELEAALDAHVERRALGMSATDAATLLKRDAFGPEAA